MVKAAQINIGKRLTASDEGNIRVIEDDIEILFMQEPSNTNKKVKAPPSGKVFHDHKIPVRAAIWVRNDLANQTDCMLMTQFTNKDMATVQLCMKSPEKTQFKVIICSLYLPTLDCNNKLISNPINDSIEDLLAYSQKKKIDIFFASDCNAHSTLWGDKNNDLRGNNIIDCLNKFDLFLANKGSQPTFAVGNRKSVIDISFGSRDIIERIKNWRVDPNESFSDHKFIYFELLTAKTIPSSIRTKKKTNWIKYKEIVKKELDKFEINISNPTEFNDTAEKLSCVLLNAFNKCCKEKIIKTNNNNDWFNNELASERNKLKKLRRHIDKEFKKTKNLAFVHNLYEKYKKMKNEYNNKCHKAKTRSWKKKTSELDNCKETARLIKILENSKTTEIGSLMKLDGTYTNDLKESYDLLVKTHFPNCTENAEIHIKDKFEINHDNQENDIARIVTTEKISWAINSLSPFKAAGQDGIFPALIQKAEEYISPIIKALFCASLTYSFIPISWRGTLVRFIPKADKVSYDTPKSFRPISLMSFFLKILEKLVDYDIRTNLLSKNPLNKMQHAYQKGKGTESASHHLVNEIEKSLNNKGSTITVFIDIEGAFDQTSHDNIAKAASKMGIDECLVSWIRAVLKNRLVKARDKDETYFNPTKGCAQGACLSPLLWCLVVNSLINKLSAKGFIVTAYADDLAISISGKNKFTNEMCDKMNRVAMKILEDWCNETGLRVSPEKSCVIRFTKSYKNNQSLNIKLFGKIISTVNETKYLGIILDNKLSWNKHIDYAINKGRKTLWAARNLVSKKWGLNPTRMLWIYKQIVLPKITFGCILWWHRTLIKNVSVKLESLQRMALMLMTGAMKTTPTLALEAALNILPLRIQITKTAFQSFVRLKTNQMWINDFNLGGHKSIEKLIQIDVNFLDLSSKEIETKYKVLINEKSNWSFSLHVKNNPWCWSVDGSVKKNQAGIGSYNYFRDQGKYWRISDKVSSAQTEMIAIEMCAHEINKENLIGKRITLLTDSKSSLTSLNKLFSGSHYADDCKNEINKLATSNKVIIAWCPKSMGGVYIDKADKLANQGRRKTQIDINKNITSNKIEESLENWGKNEANKLWSQLGNKLVHSQRFIEPFNAEFSSHLKNLSRINIRNAFCVLTGHFCSQYFLKNIGKSASDKCRLCKNNNEKETMLHILTNCEGCTKEREISFGLKYIDPNDTCNLSIKALIKFSKENQIREFLINRL